MFREKPFSKFCVSTALAAAVIVTPAMSNNVSAMAVDAPSSNGVLSNGDQSGQVGSLQQDLNDLGYSVSVDNIYGPDTEEAVRSFQSDQGIQVDGIVGSGTNSALASNGADNTNVSDESVSSDVNGESETGSTEAVSNGSLGTEAVSVAESLLGKPYQFGGTTPAGFDSSGFVNYVYNQIGVDRSRTHEAMWANDGTPVDNPSPGDQVFFENTYKNGISHSGIYIGNGQMIHAGTEATGVEVTNINYDYWQSRYIGAKSIQ